jgi:hypothetical protein
MSDRREALLPVAIELTRYHLTLTAQEPIHVSAYKGSALRGGFGTSFKRMVCFQPQVKHCNPCLLRHNCPYPYLFESFPPPDAEVLSKNAYIARPIVIEPPLNERTDYAPSEELAFSFVLVGRAQQYLAYLVVAFQELGRAGLGRGRGRFRVTRVEAAHPLRGATARVFQEEDPETIRMPRLSVTVGEITQRAAGLNPEHAHLRFLTPTRLVHKGHMVDTPPFHVLVRRLLDRVSSLSYFHCGERWEIDFKGLIQQAKAVEIVECDTRWENVERYSGRQKARLSIGGFVGDVVYEGDLTPFRELLLLGSLIHVGKATVFGNGRYEIVTD